MRTRKQLLAATLTLSAMVITTYCAPALAQTAAPAVPTGPLPTDITPIRLREEREMLRPGPSLYLFQKLPANLWFNTTTEVNGRFESNVFLTANNPKRDIVFRTFPTMTVGYNFLKNTGIYTNYFMIKDVYADTTPGVVHLTKPTTQSLSLGLRHNRQIGRTNLQFDFQTRELWQNRGLRQFDYLPGMLVSRALSPHTFGFMNLQLQMRGKNPFVAPTRELDPFYTLGLIHSFGQWTMSVTDTFITNFRDGPFRGSVPAQGNAEMIADIEVYHPIVKRYPNVVGFLRAEPIWNWRSNRVEGLSGFDFRLYSGVRVNFAKPALGNIVNQVKKETLPDQNKKIEIQEVPGAPAPTPGQPISSEQSQSLLSSSKGVAPKETKKTSLLQRLTAFAKGQDNTADAQPPIIMIQNSLNPFGPMIPTLAQPLQSATSTNKNANSDLRTQLASEQINSEISDRLSRTNVPASQANLADPSKIEAPVPTNCGNEAVEVN